MLQRALKQRFHLLLNPQIPQKPGKRPPLHLELTLIDPAAVRTGNFIEHPDHPPENRDRTADILSREGIRRDVYSSGEKDGEIFSPK
jgi:hypothetical protein